MRPNGPEPSENARKSLAGYGKKFPTKLWNGDGADTPVETTCSLIGLPSDTVFLKEGNSVPAVLKDSGVVATLQQAGRINFFTNFSHFTL